MTNDSKIHKVKSVVAETSTRRAATTHVMATAISISVPYFRHEKSGDVSSAAAAGTSVSVVRGASARCGAVAQSSARVAVGIVAVNIATDTIARLDGEVGSVVKTGATSGGDTLDTVCPGVGTIVRGIFRRHQLHWVSAFNTAVSWSKNDRRQ